MDAPAVITNPCAPDLTIDEWLALRRKSLGGSEAAAAVGESRWRSPMELWARKRGLLPEEDLSEREAVQWGRLQEPTIVAEACRRKGRVLLDAAQRRKAEQALTTDGSCEVVGWVEGRQAFVRSLARPWQTATYDGLALDPERGLGSIEAKTTDARFSSEWTDEQEAPDEYQLQVVHGLAVCGALRWGALAGLIGGNRLRQLDVAREAAPVDLLIGLEQVFMASLESEEPPAYDGSASARRVLAILHPDDNGQTVILDERWIALHEEWERCKAAKKQAGDRIDEIKGELLAALGDNTFGALPNGAGMYSLKTQERAEHTVKATKFRKPWFTASKAGKAKR